MEKTNVTIALDQNVVWEVERVYPLEIDSYWWTKPELKQIRDDYKNEVMMEGVKNLVRVRVQQEEKDSRVVEQRVEEIMQRDPGSIANFLQSIPTKTEILLPNCNSDLDCSKDSHLVPDSASDSDSDSDSESESESHSSTSSSSSGEEDEEEEDQLVGAATNLKITRKLELSSPSNRIEDSLSSTSSVDNDNDSRSCASSSSLTSSPKGALMALQSHDGESKMEENNSGINGVVPPPTTALLQPVDERMLSPTSISESAGEITPKMCKSIGKQVNELHNVDQTPCMEIRCDLKPENRQSLRKRFRQGVLAVVAIERLEKMVKRDAAPPSTHKMLSSSSRLIETYLPSDNENDDPVWSGEGDSDHFSDDTAECPVCLDLVDPGQQRKIILLRRMLCKGCYFSHYINREDTCRSGDYKIKSSKRNNGELQHCSEKMDFNAKRDVQTLNSLKRCISSTNESPMVPVLPLPKLKSTMLREKLFRYGDEKTERNAKSAIVRRKKLSSGQRNGEKSRRKR